MVDQVEGVEVKLGADAAPAQRGMEDAQTSIANSLAKISESLQHFGSANQRTMDEAIKNNANLSRSFLELKASATGGFNAIAGVIERFRGVLGTLTAALAGGAIFKGSVDAMLHLEADVRALSESFGISAEKATTMAINLRLAGVSAEAFEMMAQRVGMRIRLQADEFDRLGVKIKDARGDLLPMDQILQNIYQRMLDFKAGTDQTLFALTTVGRNAKDFQSDMERITATTQRAAEMQRQLGIEMGPDRIAQIERYRVEVNAFRILLEEIGTRIGEAVLPRLESLATWFSDKGPTAIKYSVDAVKIFITVLESLGALVASVAAVATSAFEYLVHGQKMSADAIVQIWEDATASVNRMWADLASPKFGMGDRGIGAEGALPSGRNLRFTPKPTGGAAEDVMAKLENQLKAQQDAFNRMKLDQGSFETWSINQTLAYWEKILAAGNLAAKDQIAVENKIYDARRMILEKSFAAYMTSLEAEKAALGHNIEAKIAIQQKEVDAAAQKYGQESAQAQIEYKKMGELRQQLADQRLRIADIEEKAEEVTAKHAIELNKLGADQAVALQQMSAEQRLSVERDFITREYEIEADGLRRRIELLASDPTSDPVKVAELKSRLLAIEQDYQTQLTRIDNAAVLEREKYALQANDAIKSSLSDTLAKLVENTQNWKKTLMDAFKALDDQLVKIAANKLVDQLFGGGTAGGDFLSKITGGIFGGGAGASAEVAAQTANTTALGALTAAVSANTAALSTSSMGGLFGGGGMGFGFGGGGLGFGFPGFQHGTDFVPRTMVAVVHRGEAIIPASANKPGIVGGVVNMRNTFMFSGPVDTRTQSQIAQNVARSTDRAMRRSR